MTAQLHAAAVLARLRTSGSPALLVFDGRVEDEDDPDAVIVPPYVLVRFTFQWLGADARPDASNLTMASLPLQVTARMYEVADNARGARALANRVSVALLDWTPVVAGRSCSPMRHIDSFEPDDDEKTGAGYFQAGEDYRFTSHPA